jgi:peptide deformylase
MMIKSAGATFPPEYSDRNLMVKTVYERDVGQWQLQSFSSCICQKQDTTHMANPVITATASAIQHSSGCISVCPASFIPVTVIVT